MFHELDQRTGLRRKARPDGAACASADDPGHDLVRVPLRAFSLGAILLVIAVAVSACGGADPKLTGDPTEAASVSETPTPTPTPSATPTPTTEPLSAFEDQAPVKAARAWATAMAEAVNARDRKLTAVVPLATARGLAQSKVLAEPDIDANVVRPGPQPFTPVNVQIKGRVARVSTCYMTFGWALNRKTKKPAEARKVTAIILEIHRVRDQWKFEYGQQGTGDCDGVRIQEVRWGS